MRIYLKRYSTMRRSNAAIGSDECRKRTSRRRASGISEAVVVILCSIPANAARPWPGMTRAARCDAKYFVTFQFFSLCLLVFSC